MAIIHLIWTYLIVFDFIIILYCFSPVSSGKAPVTVIWNLPNESLIKKCPQACLQVDLMRAFSLLRFFSLSDGPGLCSDNSKQHAIGLFFKIQVVLFSLKWLYCLTHTYAFSFYFVHTWFPIVSSFITLGRCLQKVEGIRSPDTAFKVVWDTWYVCWELNPCLLQEQ